MRKSLAIIILTIICTPVFGQKALPKYVENGVSGIKLRDQETVEKVLGKGKNYVDQNDNKTDVINDDGKQLLTMIFYPGGTINEFYAFKVQYNTEQLKPELKIETKDFVTSKKIRLGMTEKQVKIKLGAPAIIMTEEGLTIWTYYNKVDLYFGRYDFRNGYLIQFWFGEDYP